MQDGLRQSIEEAARAIAGARHVVALVGAGLSAESGVPTFRGPEGLWTKHGEPDLRDYERFIQDPKAWWEQRIARQSRFAEMVEALEHAQPNPGHRALCEMEDLGYLKHIITQNIDNLHREPRDHRDPWQPHQATVRGVRKPLAAGRIRD